jgi:hypothetical protein
MSTKYKSPGKLYQIFKIYKEHTPPTLPPGCPVIIGCVSVTDNLSLFVDQHAKYLVQEIPPYLQDTPDFLCQSDELNNTTLPDETFTVSIDVVGFYSHILNEEGLECFIDDSNKRADKTVPTDLLVTWLSFGLQLFINQVFLKFHL